MRVTSITPSSQKQATGGYYIGTGYADIDDALEKSRGQIVFQEDLMWLFAKVCDLEFGGADNVRRITAKKYEMDNPKERDIILGAKKQWLEGCANKGIDDVTANEWWEKILANSGYSFNRSHAVAYSIATVITMIMKHEKPLEYAAAYLSVYPDKKSVWIRDLVIQGYELIAPHINKSGAERYSVKDGKLALNLLTIDRLGLKGANYIEDVRPFDDYKNMMYKLSSEGQRLVNRTSRLRLWLLGALDGLEGTLPDLDTFYRVTVYKDNIEWDIEDYWILKHFIEYGYGVRVYDLKARVSDRRKVKFEYSNKMRLQSDLLGGNILYGNRSREILKQYIEKDYEFGIVTKIVNGKSSTGRDRVEVYIGKSSSADFYYQEAWQSAITKRLKKPLEVGMFIVYRRDKDNWGGRYLDNVGTWKKPNVAIYDITDKFDIKED